MGKCIACSTLWPSRGVVENGHIKHIHADEEFKKISASKYTFSRGETLVLTPKNTHVTALSPRR